MKERDLRRRPLDLLSSRDEVDAFKAEHGVKTTPQTFIDGTRIGGYDALREHFGEKVKGADETSYRPVLAIFGVCALMALAVSHFAFGELFTVRTVEWFAAFPMCVLAIQKLQDIERFSTMFLSLTENLVMPAMGFWMLAK